VGSGVKIAAVTIYFTADKRRSGQLQLNHGEENRDWLDPQQCNVHTIHDLWMHQLLPYYTSLPAAGVDSHKQEITDEQMN
jgi:hypothetical protein